MKCMKIGGDCLPDACRSLAESDSWGKACGKLAEGCGDYSWRKPGGSLRGAAETTSAESPRKPAKGCGDYSWRKSGEAREGLRRLLLEEVSGKPAKWRELAAKWRELAAKLGAKIAKWREVAAKWRELTAKCREVARSS